MLHHKPTQNTEALLHHTIRERERERERDRETERQRDREREREVVGLVI